ncbi:unnamed protein product, partial [Meganyctiphanes norvegica]
TPLNRACFEGHLPIVQELMRASANPDTPNNDSETPLYVASVEGHPSIVQELLKADANKDIPNKFGKRPLDVARKNAHKAVVDNLLAAPAVAKPVTDVMTAAVDPIISDVAPSTSAADPIAELNPDSEVDQKDSTEPEEQALLEDGPKS